MITPITQAAIAVLNDIYAGGDTARTDTCHLSGQDLNSLLSKLLRAGLIKLSDQGDPRNIRSYIPAREFSDVSPSRHPRSHWRASELQPSHY